MIYVVDRSDTIYPDFPTISIETMLDYFKDKSEIGFDTETTGFDPYTDKILTYQLGISTDQFVVNAEYYPVRNVKEILEDRSKTWIMHNAAFDCLFLYHNNIIPSNIWDSFLAEAVLYKGDPSVRKALSDVAYRYCNVTLDKAARGLIYRDNLNKRVINYAAGDVKFLPAIKRNQEQLLDSKGLMKSISLENKFVKVLTYVKYCGIKLNADCWTNKCNEDAKLLKSLEQQLDTWIEDNNIKEYIDTQLSLDIFGEHRKVKIQWSSPKQVVALFKKLGIPVWTAEDKETADVRHIQRYQDDFSILPIYMEYKKVEKLVSTYGMEVLKNINSITNRIHTSFKQIMKTGRISSGDKSSAKYSINLQNLPADERHRGCFIPEEGNVFVNADYSQQEAVVFANKTQDKNLIEFFEKGLGDMHSYIASKIYPELAEVPLAEIKKKYPELRDKAKSASFALQYGGNGNTIADNLNLTKEEGNNIYLAYFEAFPGVRQYFDYVARKSFEDGYVLIDEVTKSKCFIFQFSEYKRLKTRVNNPGFWQDYNREKQKGSVTFENILKPMVTKYFTMKGQIERMAYNYPIQGTAAAMTKVAALYLFNYIVEHKLFHRVKIVNLIHDEIILEVPEELAEAIAEQTKYYMEQAGDIFCNIIPVKAVPVVSKKWEH